MIDVESKIIKAGSNIPARLKELWIWFEAVYEWDWGDPGLLAALIREEQIPPEFQIALSDIVAGVRKRRNYGKSKGSAQERLILARVAMEYAEVRDEILTDRAEVDRLSEEMGKEPHEIIHKIQATIRNELKLRCEEVGAEIETVKKIRKDFQSRINRWPTV